MFKRNTILKVLCIIPYTLLINAFDLISDSLDTSVAELLIGKMTSRVTFGAMIMLLFAMENLGYLILFNILFGNQISNLVKSAPTMRFSRIRRRNFWFYKECLKLLGIVGIYSALYVGILTWMCVRLSVYDMDLEAAGIMLLFFLTCIALLMLTTVPINLLSISYGTARGFLMVYTGIVALVTLAIGSRNEILQFINPMCFFSLMESSMGVQCMRILYDILVAVGICFLGGRYMQRRDIL